MLLRASNPVLDLVKFDRRQRDALSGREITMKTGRNQPCLCGSGLKYKKCCGALDAIPQGVPFGLKQALDRNAADEMIRQQQQGLGRPIVSFKARDHQVIAVGNTVHYSKTWKTFPDFLADYMKRIVGEPWGNSELRKPMADRHPVIQWYDAYCRYQQAAVRTPGGVVQTIVTGVVACYLGLAYGLYLLAHNVELQEKLVRRLKIVDQFQGAYYEVLVAGILIRAGFDLALEDESDGSVKHCEFSARSRRTGRKFWVEAKMRSVSGLLGKTDVDGTKSTNPINRFVPQLNEALAKPAADERLIFIDLNAEQQPQQAGQPAWIEQAARRMEKYEEKELADGVVAYVFVTNFSFHRALNEPASMAGFFFGLGIPDLNRPGIRRVTEAYKTRLKHIDVYHIGDALQDCVKFPSTFDGRMPSEAMNRPSRVVIGETYCFGDPEDGGVVGTVTYASVNEAESEALIAITDKQGRSMLWRGPMSPEEMADWRSHKDSYFGKILPVSKTINNPFEMFEWFVEQYKYLTRTQMLERFDKYRYKDLLSDLGDEDLLYLYCEGLVGALPSYRSEAVPKP